MLVAVEDLGAMSPQVLRWMQEWTADETPVTRQYTITGLLTETEHHRLEQTLGEVVPDQCMTRRIEPVQQSQEVEHTLPDRTGAEPESALMGLGVGRAVGTGGG